MPGWLKKVASGIRERYILMNSHSRTQQMSETITLRDILREACVHAEAGEYMAALAAIREARRAHSTSIYLLAFERQVEQLREYTEAGDNTHMQQEDILQSLPGLAERAAEEPDATPEKVADSFSRTAKEEEKAAGRWLVAQYLQHAYQYLLRQEYRNAIAELHRIYVVDPENVPAKDLEQRILQIMKEKATT